MYNKDKFPYINAVVALTAAILLGCRDNPKTVKHMHFSDDVARDIIVEHYKQEGRETIQPSVLRLIPVGEDFRIVLVPIQGMQPVSQESWVVGKGRSSPNLLNIESLKMAFSNSYPTCHSDKERLDAAKRFVELLSFQGMNVIVAGPAKVIDNINQIPGYEKTPPDSDISSAIRPPYKPSEHELVLYTYRQAGGSVCRFKFVFDQKGQFHDVSFALLDERVGDFHMFR